MLAAAVPHGPALCKAHPERIHGKKVSTEVRPVLTGPYLVFKRVQDAFRAITTDSLQRLEAPPPKRPAVEICLDALHLPSPPLVWFPVFFPGSALSFRMGTHLANATVSDPPSVHYKAEFPIDNN